MLQELKYHSSENSSLKLQLNYSVYHPFLMFSGTASLLALTANVTGLLFFCSSVVSHLFQFSGLFCEIGGLL
jgi:hypothetical protein